MLAYADATGNEQVWVAVKRAVDCNDGRICRQEQPESGITRRNVHRRLEELHARSGDRKYLEFGQRIYRERANLAEFHRQPLKDGKFQKCYGDGHGATVVESMRMPFWFWAATGDPEYLRLGVNVVAAMNGFTMPAARW